MADIATPRKRVGRSSVFEVHEPSRPAIDQLHREALGAAFFCAGSPVLPTQALAALTLLFRFPQITSPPPKSQTLSSPLSTPRRRASSLSTGLEASAQAHHGDVATRVTGLPVSSDPRSDPDVFGMSDYDLTQQGGQERPLPPSPPNPTPAAAEESCPQHPDHANCMLVLPPFLVDGPSGGSQFDVGLRFSEFLTVR